MHDLYSDRIEKLLDKLEIIEDTSHINESWIQESLIASMDCLNDIRVLFLSRINLLHEEEVSFFKNFKPLVLSRVIYFGKLLNINRKELQLRTSELDSFYNDQLEVINDYKRYNLRLSEYIDLGDTHLDHKYFTRLSDININYFGIEFYEYDRQFTTDYDIIISKLIANRLLESYILTQINKTKINIDQSISNLQWTGSKSELVELIYALHFTKLVNNGNSSIIDYARSISKVFNIDLEDVFRIFVKIKNRSGSKTRALDRMTKAFKDNYDLF